MGYMKGKLDTELRNKLSMEVRARHEARAALHEPSGKLSAGQLGKPLLEQVLKIIGVPSKPLEDYTLGLFARGDQVEDYILDLIKPDETQVEINYRGCIGFIDAIKDGDVYEVKSIKNSGVRYIDPENPKEMFKLQSDGTKKKVREYNGAKFMNVLQGTMYALAKDKDYFKLVYASADDLRTFPIEVDITESRVMVDRIIDEVAAQLRRGELPAYAPRIDFDGQPVSWQTGPKVADYAGYPEWVMLPQELMMEKLQRQFPHAYERLISLKAK